MKCVDCKIARAEARDFRDYAKTEVPGNLACSAAAKSLQCCSNEPAVKQQQAVVLQPGNQQSSKEPAILLQQPISSANQSLCATSEPGHPRLDAQITVVPVDQPRLDAQPEHSRLNARMAVAFVNQLTLNA